MEKRLIAAIGLSLLVLLGWSFLASRFFPATITPGQVSVQADAQSNQPPVQPVKTAPAPTPLAEPSAPTVSINLPSSEILIAQDVGSIYRVYFKKYQNHQFSLKSAFAFEQDQPKYARQAAAEDQILFLYQDKTRLVTKKYKFHKLSYIIDLAIEVKNTSATELLFDPSLTLGMLDFSGDQNAARYRDVTAVTKEKTTHHNGRSSAEFSDLQFIGLRDQYFCLIVKPVDFPFTGFIRKITNHESLVGIKAGPVSVPPGQSRSFNFHIYLGPQDLKLINTVNPAYSAVVYYGTFDFISNLLVQLLDFIHNLVHNWGWAVVILSILISLLLYPLTLQQTRSMKQMQLLQPRIEALRASHKDNPQKLNKEIMELYREQKVNPFGGCLPLILQIPVFFALYQAMIRSVSLKGAHFLWIKDLSAPDRLFLLPPDFIVKEINLLPILMTAIMFVQQKMSMRTAAAANEQQKIMMFMMPAVFLFIFYNMPAGLVLYWFINSSIMLVNQIQINRVK